MTLYIVVNLRVCFFFDRHSLVPRPSHVFTLYLKDRSWTAALMMGIALQARLALFFL